MHNKNEGIRIGSVITKQGEKVTGATGKDFGVTDYERKQVWTFRDDKKDGKFLIENQITSQRLTVDSARKLQTRTGPPDSHDYFTLEKAPESDLGGYYIINQEMKCQLFFSNDQKPTDENPNGVLACANTPKMNDQTWTLCNGYVVPIIREVPKPEPKPAPKPKPEPPKPVGGIYIDDEPNKIDPS